MITIYQINTQIGQNAIDAKRKLMFGSEDFNPDMLQYFVPVAKVHTNDLEEAFEATNIQTDTVIEHFGKMHFTSVGDIFSKNGRFYMVDNFGFKELFLFDDEIEEIGMAA
jgi:uncharacterized secreted protein with C-terminal beta-propeller domain